MGTEQDLRRIADLAKMTTETAARGSTIGLAALLAEMQALGAMLPCHSTQTEAERRAVEAETEAMFDNMPV